MKKEKNIDSTEGDSTLATQWNAASLSEEEMNTLSEKTRAAIEMSKAAAILGKKGGSAKSEKKSLAVRANAQLPRPRGRKKDLAKLPDTVRNLLLF